MASSVHERAKEIREGRKKESRSENRPTKSLELNYRILSERPWEPALISVDISRSTDHSRDSTQQGERKMSASC